MASSVVIEAPLEIEPAAPAALAREPSAALAALDQELRNRFAKRTGSLNIFLREWIKLDHAGNMFFNARGLEDENYLQFELARAELPMALAIVEMCVMFAESLDAAPVIAFLNHIDRAGNDVWHYLAASLISSEDEEALAIAKILIRLEIDYCRKNDRDESPLARLLIPEARWQSVNTLLLAKQLTVTEMEQSLPQRILENEAVKAEIMTGILTSDLLDNQGILTNYLLQEGVRSSTERAERAALGKVFFEYIGGRRSETVFMKVIETDHREIFEKMLNLVQLCAEDYYCQMAGNDGQLARTLHQAYYYRRVARRNRIFQSVIHKAVIADKAPYIASMLNLVHNDNLTIAKRSGSGLLERELLVIDKNSPAPCNPGLALLLQQDARGNLPVHAAVLGGKEDCLRKLIYGQSMANLYAILARIPNRYNLTVIDLLSPQRAHAKLTLEIKAQRLTIADAQAIMQAIKAIDQRLQQFLTEIIRKAEDAIARAGGPQSARPSFDLRRVPTLIQQGQKASPVSNPALAARSAHVQAQRPNA